MGNEFIRQIMILGAVPTLGPVVMFDDIEDLLKWDKSGTGGDDLLEKIATVAYNGSASLHMKSRDTNKVEGDVIQATRMSFQRPGKRYRMELLFKHVADAETKEVTVQLYVYDGTNCHAGIFKYDAANHKWQYLNSGGTYTDIVGGAQNLDATGWHRFLMEVNHETGEYIRFVCDGLELDMSGISYYSSASAVAVKLQAIMTGKAGGSPPADIYFDDVLVMEI